jgi:hypothetical protein
VYQRVSDHVVVVERQQRRAAVFIWLQARGQVIEQGRQVRRGTGGRKRRQQGAGSRGAAGGQRIQPVEHARPEVARVVVGRLERKPGGPARIVGDPAGQQRGLTVPSRRDDQSHELVIGAQAFTQSFTRDVAPPYRRHARPRPADAVEVRGRRGRGRRDRLRQGAGGGGQALDRQVA